MWSHIRSAACQRKGSKIQQGASLTQRHFDPRAIIPFKLTQALTWGHMFGKAQELSCVISSGQDTGKHFDRLSHSPLPVASRSVIKSSYEDRRDISKRGEKHKKCKKYLHWWHNLSLREDSKVNYIKQTYVILIPLKLWITALINHTLIWVLILYVPHHWEISLFLSSTGLDYFSPLPELFFIAWGFQLNYLCQTIICSFNLIVITPLSYFN